MDAPAPPPRRSVLFVCTGNTCRSPLAEALCRRMLADRLGCDPGELAARGFAVASAGVMAYPGDAASPPGVDVAAEMRADLTAHRSRMVHPDLLAAATDVIAMTRGHLMALRAAFPGVGPEPVLLCDGDDLPDPIGGGADEYRACARQIADNLDRFLRGWLGP
jgi:protein-tyrosine-phosphatase